MKNEDAAGVGERAGRPGDGGDGAVTQLHDEPSPRPRTTVMPEVSFYPVCRKCRRPWVLRRVMALNNEPEWLWQPDCKHRNGLADLMEE